MTDIIVGKDVIELLGSAMYRDPLSVYREYIQNSVDAIDDAVKKSILANRNESRIEIKIDYSSRKISIRDNGAGISKSTFKRKMLAIGASGKKQSTARGFRGIGRLAGLGFCQELIFRTREKGQDVSQVKWSIRDIRAVLTDSKNEADLAKLIESATEFQTFPSEEYPERFFEVELVRPIRIGGDVLLNVDRVKSYISQVGPVPFSPEFKFADNIRSHISEYQPLSEYNIYINDSESPVVKPYSNLIQFSDTKFGSISDDLDLFEIENSNGKTAAVGWIAHSDYLGAIPTKSLVGGLRARIGNLQIGGNRIFSEAFPEPRFSAWTVGEIHIIDKKLIPNARRDGFEHNKAFSDLVIKLLPHGHTVAKKCRSLSIIRNNRKRYEGAVSRAAEISEIVLQKAVSETYLLQKISEGRGYLDDAMRLLPQAEFDARIRRQEENKLETLTTILKSENAGASSFNAEVDNLPLAERELLNKVCALIYECSTNQSNAKLLIDKILVRL